jgi:hypothetical protein
MSDEQPEIISKEKFELLYRQFMDRGGHSYDPWDIAVSWDRFQRAPQEFLWLFPG